MSVYSYNQGSVQTAFAQYIAYDLSNTSITPSGVPLQLYWPNTYQNSPNVVASFINIIGSLPNPLSSLQLPDASQVGVGTAFQVFNSSENIISVLDVNGNIVTVIAGSPEDSDPIVAGGITQFVLADNSNPDTNPTVPGVWVCYQVGEGVSAGVAAQLAGYGLIADPINPTFLDTNIPTRTIGGSASTGQITLSDRAGLVRWASTGSGILTLPPLTGVGSVPAGFYFLFSNVGGGNVTLTTPNSATMIDKSAGTKVVAIGSSAILSTDGTNWTSVGFGIPIFLSYNQVNIAVTGSTLLVDGSLTVNEFLNFTGTLTAPSTITFSTPSVFGWYVYNNTGQTLTFLPSATPNITLPNGERIIIYGNGTELFVIPTITPPGSDLFEDGDAAAPGITFVKDNTTGIYRNSTLTTLGFSQDGKEVFELGVSGDVSSIYVPDTLSFVINNDPVGESPINIQLNPLTTAVQLLIQGVGSSPLSLTNLILSTPVAGLSISKGTNEDTLLKPSVESPGINPNITLSSAITTIAGTTSIVLNTPSLTLPTLSSLTVSGLLSAGSLSLGTPLTLANGGTSGDSSLTAANNILLPIATTTGDLLVNSSGSIARLPVSTTPGKSLISINGTAALPAYTAQSIVQVIPSPTLNTIIGPLSNSTGPSVLIPGFTSSITPLYSNSKVQINITFNCTAVIPYNLMVGGSAASVGVSFYLYRNNVAIATGGGTGTNSTAFIAIPSLIVPGNTNSSVTTQNISINYLDNPNAIINQTYELRAIISTGSNSSYYINGYSGTIGIATFQLTEIGGFQ